MGKMFKKTPAAWDSYMPVRCPMSIYIYSVGIRLAPGSKLKKGTARRKIDVAADGAAGR